MGKRFHRAGTIRAAAAALALAAAAGWGFFAAVRAIFGESIGAGYHGPAATLCALDRDGSAGLIVGGDSRAKTQIDPAVIEARAGIKAVNAAEAFPFGGDLSTFVNSLRANPRALESAPVIVISVSLQGVNDLRLDAQPMAGVWNWTAWNHLRVATADPGGYLGWARERYLPGLWREALHRARRERFACTEAVGIPADQAAARGYRPNAGKAPRLIEDWRGGWLIDNGGWEAFRSALAWLEASPAKAIVLVDMPLRADWVRSGYGPEWPASQARFDGALARLTAGRSKLRFLDLTDPARIGIDTAEFFDMLHLDAGGSAKLSGWLADWLGREFRGVAAR